MNLQKQTKQCALFLYVVSLALWHPQIALAAPQPPTQTSFAGAYRIVDLGLLPGAKRGAPVGAAGVNNDGVVVGGCGQKPFRWTAKSGMRALPLPPGSKGIAVAVNDAGWIVGLYDSGACAWTPQGKFVSIGKLPDYDKVHLFAFGADGAAYGYVRAYKTGNSSRAVVWRPGGTIQEVGVAIRSPAAQSLFYGAGGTFACGTCTVLTGGPVTFADRACLWDAERGFRPLAAPSGSEPLQSEAFGVNARGDAVGRVTLNPKGSYACLWRADANEPLDLGRLEGGINFSAGRINSSGDIIGSYNDAQNRGRVFVWSERQGMRPVEDLLTKDSRRWNIEGASALSDRGEFVGMCSRGGIGYAYLAVPVAGSAVRGAADAAAGSGTGPRPGEIQLTGTVMSVSAGQRSLRLRVSAVTQSNGTSVTLPAPRLKTILLGADTHTVTASSAPISLTAVKVGAALTVIGPDGGVGRTLTARTVILP